eukprot:scaffold5682_cov229-Pinguiococcus_pyrenoidosus.AAC.3
MRIGQVQQQDDLGAQHLHGRGQGRPRLLQGRRTNDVQRVRGVEDPFTELRGRRCCCCTRRCRRANDPTGGDVVHNPQDCAQRVVPGFADSRAGLLCRGVHRHVQRVQKRPRRLRPKLGELADVGGWQPEEVVGRCRESCRSRCRRRGLARTLHLLHQLDRDNQLVPEGHLLGDLSGRELVKDGPHGRDGNRLHVGLQVAPQISVRQVLPQELSQLHDVADSRARVCSDVLGKLRQRDPDRILMNLRLRRRQGGHDRRGMNRKHREVAHVQAFRDVEVLVGLSVAEGSQQLHHRLGASRQGPLAIRGWLSIGHEMERCGEDLRDEAKKQLIARHR